MAISLSLNSTFSSSLTGLFTTVPSFTLGLPLSSTDHDTTLRSFSDDSSFATALLSTLTPASVSSSDGSFLLSSPGPLPSSHESTFRTSRVIPTPTTTPSSSSNDPSDCPAPIESVLPVSLVVETLPGGAVATVQSYALLPMPTGSPSDCCGICDLCYFDVQVFYWPVPDANTACLNNASTSPIAARSVYHSITSVPTLPSSGATPSAYVTGSDGFVYTSPSVYVAFPLIQASDSCGQVGPNVTSLTLAFAPGELSTIQFPMGYTYAPYASNFNPSVGTTKVFEPSDMPCGPYGGQNAYLPNSAGVSIYEPIVAKPQKLSNYLPSDWSSCSNNYYNGQDPPYPLTPQSVLVVGPQTQYPPPDPASIITSADPEPLTTAAAPVSTSTPTPWNTGFSADPTLSDIATLLPMSTIVVHGGSVTTSAAGEFNVDPAPTIPEHTSFVVVHGITVLVVSSAGIPLTTETPEIDPSPMPSDNPLISEVIGSPISYLQAEGATITEGIETPISFAVVDGATIAQVTEAPVSYLAVDGTTVTEGVETPISYVVVDGTTKATITAAPISYLAVNGHTITEGVETPLSYLVVDGTTISTITEAPISYLAIDGTTLPAPPPNYFLLAGTPVPEGVETPLSYLVVDGSTLATYAEAPVSYVVVDGTTVTEGEPGVTVDGTFVSLGPSVLVVGTSTETLAQASGAGLGGWILSGLGAVPTETAAPTELVFSGEAAGRRRGRGWVYWSVSICMLVCVLGW